MATCADGSIPWGDLNIKEDVILTGYKHNPFSYLARADVFILSSFFEGFGNVIVEAMALGIPVIASDCPAGPAEIIHDGLDGYLVEVGDSTALAERCLLLLNNLHISEKLSLCARTRAQDFCVQRMVDGYISVFEEVMAPVFR